MRYGFKEDLLAEWHHKMQHDMMHLQVLDTNFAWQRQPGQRPKTRVPTAQTKYLEDN